MAVVFDVGTGFSLDDDKPQGGQLRPQADPQADSQTSS